MFNPEKRFSSSVVPQEEQKRKTESTQELKEEEKEPKFDAAVVFGNNITEKSITTKWKEVIEDGKPKMIPAEKEKKWDLTIGGKLRSLGAYELYRKGEVREIFLTGGHVKGSDAPSEAELMKEYIERKALADLRLKLRKEGLSQDDIDTACREETEKLNQVLRLEEGATNTIENFAYTLNEIDDDPEKYKNIAFLSNQFHLPRIQAIAEQFNTTGENISAESAVYERGTRKDQIVGKETPGERYQKFLDKTTNTEDPEIMDQLKAEERWERGMKETPEYWIMQAAYVNQDRLKEMIAVNRILQEFIQKQIGVGFEKRFNKSVTEIEAMTEEEFGYLQEEIKKVKRELPPEEWAKLSVEEKYTSKGK